MSRPEMSDPATPTFAEPFLRGLRLAVWAIAATVLLSVLVSLAFLRDLAVYQPLWAQAVAIGILLALLAAELMLIFRHRGWEGQLRWWGLAAVLLAELTTRLSLPGDAVATAADWAFGTIGWFGLLVLLDKPLTWILVVLISHESFAVAAVLRAGATHSDVLLNLAVASLGAVGYPLASAVAATALRGIAARAEAASRIAGEIRTEEAVAIRVHEHRRQRFADLRDGIVPLLQGLADGVLDPSAERVRRACAIESFRMRRLFAETDNAQDPLLHELSHCVSAAERNRVVVDWENSGTWPTLPVGIRRALTDGPVAALATATSRARVTVVGLPGQVTVSVVADCAPLELPTATEPSVEVTTTEWGRMLCVEARWTSA